MGRPRASFRDVLRNLRDPGLPPHVRARLALRNALRRLGPPPRDCCGHPGEPGC